MAFSEPTPVKLNKKRTRNVMKVPLEAKDKGKRLRDYLRNDLKLSGRNIKRLAMDRGIYIGRKSVHLDYIIKGDESLLINLDRAESQDMAKVKMRLDIAYEDSSLIVVNKPPYLVVHPTRNHQDDTLTNGVLYHFGETGDPSIVRLVSRLDMNTSGLVLIAKNQFVHSSFARFKGSDKPIKTYLGITSGLWESKSGMIDAPIHWPDPDDYRRVVDELGQPSRTGYEVLAQFNDTSLVRFILETGRTHQIRVHSKYMGHPLVGDQLYGGRLEGERPRQLLHAYALEFTHPMTQERISLTAAMPDDMQQYIINHGGSEFVPDQTKDEHCK